MFNCKVSEEQYNYALNLVNKFNFGNRGYGDGSKDEQLTGLIGQTVFADLLDLERPRGDMGFDNGIDFIINSKKVDIKTMTRTVPVKEHYVHNFIGYQLKYETEAYVFASFNKTNNILSICGCISKSEFKERALFFKKGEKRYRDDGKFFYSKAPLYEIKQCDLNQANSLEELISLI